MQYRGLTRPLAIGIFLSLIVLFSTVTLVAANFAFFLTNEIYEGVSVLDIPVGGLSQEAAESKIEAVLKERFQAGTPLLIVRDGDSQWPIAAADLHFTVVSKDLAQAAYEVGRKGNAWQQLRERMQALHEGIPIQAKPQYDQAALSQIVNSITAAVQQAPRPARLAEQDGQVQIVPEIWGKTVDKTATLAQLEEQLSLHWGSQLELRAEQQKPPLVAQDLAGIDAKLATYTTQFNPNDPNRNENIRIAARQINGIIIHPNELFSFNEIVGTRVAAAGFKEAPAYIDGKLVPDWGGGVCQVSSTLYNAVLLANLAITERTNHIEPPAYVPLGQDATVADGLIDFKFKNTSGSNLYISANMSDHQLTVTIYGKHDLTLPEIQIVRTDSQYLPLQTIIERDPALPQGREFVVSSGRSGLAVSTYRIRRINGKEIDREYLGTDQFAGSPRIVRIGTQPIRTAALPSSSAGTITPQHVTDLTKPNELKK